MSHKEFMNELLDLWENYFPQMRFCQFIENVRSRYGDQYYVENEMFLDRVREYCYEITAR